MNPSRLPSEVQDVGAFYLITSYHPKTGAAWDVRIVQKGPIDQGTFDLLDNLSRKTSQSMQRPHE